MVQRFRSWIQRFKGLGAGYKDSKVKKLDTRVERFRSGIQGLIGLGAGYTG